MDYNAFATYIETLCNDELCLDVKCQVAELLCELGDAGKLTDIQAMKLIETLATKFNTHADTWTWIEGLVKANHIIED